MSLKLSKCKDSDFPRAFEILSKAFGGELVFINGFWPQHQTEKGRADGAERLRIWAREDSWTTFMKVTAADMTGMEPPDGLMIAMAKWNVYDNEIPAEKDIDGPWWDEGRGDKAYAQTLWRAFRSGRRQAIQHSGGNLVVLDIMVVDPEYQGLGAGKLLMEWGTQQADRLDVESVTEATPAGKPLYEKFGFRFVRTQVLDLPEPWQDLKKSSHAFMKRPKRSEMDRIETQAFDFRTNSCETAPSSD